MFFRNRRESAPKYHLPKRAACPAPREYAPLTSQLFAHPCDPPAPQCPTRLPSGRTMTPRPRNPPNKAFLPPPARAMQRGTPTHLPLADVAKEAGVVPATLIQRFGTKRGLLLAMCRTAPTSVPQQFAAARTK